MVSLSSSKIIRALRSRAKKDEHAAFLFGVIRPIADDVTPLLEFIRHSFPAYPKHGIDHSTRILERIGGILSENAIKNLSSYELFCLVLAAIFHDAGMVAPESNTPNDPLIRSTHHKRSAELFLTYFPDRLALFSNQRMAQAIAFAIECHGLSWEEMQNRTEFSRHETVDGEYIRPCVIAILLRIGDLLDLDSDRTSDLCLKHCANWYASVNALDHNERHKHVKHFFYDSKKIEVAVECPNRTQYDIWFSWLEYLRLDIERANTYVFYEDLAVFRLPVPKLECKPSSEATFELWPLRFEIDESGELWDVISKSIYTGRYDYVRELIQNSIDACLRRIYEDSENTFIDASPRGWARGGYQPFVLLIVSRQDGEIVIADNGIGMDKNAVQNFLFRVAGSGMKRSSQHRSYRFPSIATFGVGFISVLTRAKKLRLITQRVSETALAEQGICIRLDANLRDAVVEKAPKSSKGTNIRLKVRDAQYVRDIRQYVTETFRYPTVEIRFLDLDELTVIVKEVRKKQIDIDLSDYEFLINYIAEGAASVEDVINAAERFVRRVRRLEESHTSRSLTTSSRQREPQLGRIGVEVFATVAAHEPPNLPVTSSLHFVISKGATISRWHIIRERVRDLPLTSALLIVPVQFSDSGLGIEWRSFHSFLVSNGVVSRSVSFVRSATFGSREFLLNKEADTYHDSIIADLDDNPIDLVDRMKRHRKPRTIDYDEDEDAFHGTMLISNRRSITRYVDIDLDSVDIESGDVELEPWQMGEIEDLFGTIADDSAEIQKTVQWYTSKQRAVFQDGIRLPVEISDIAPVGSVVGVANLLADARLTYNVSRNTLDESEDKLKAWRQNIGKIILQQIGAAVYRTFDQVGVDYVWKDLWIGEKNGNLGRLVDWTAIEK